ncbi:MAG: hypothetical protein ACTSRG_03565 [Candidatus Helarchaeota archaeon]
MSQKVKILKKQDIKLEDEAEHRSDLLEWHYLNGFIEKSPGNPYSGWKFITNFTKVRGFYDNVMFLIFPPEKDPIDLSKYSLKSRSMKFSKKKLEGRVQNDIIKGKYPDYEMYIEKESEGKMNILDIKFSPLIVPKWISVERGSRLSTDQSELSQYAFLKTGIEGKLTIGNIAAPIKAEGYYEHVWATIDPKAFKGWLWFCAPRASEVETKLSINIAIGLRPDDSFTTRFVHYTFDGVNYFGFQDFDVKILEKRVHDNMEYGFKIKITQKLEDRELNITITRDEHLSHRTHPGGFATLRFITGGARIMGYILHEGKKLEINGDSIGSAFLLSPASK